MIKVECYYNSHKELVSVRKRGKVISHADGVLLKNPEFIVQEGGRQRVLREKKKNVHAYVRGELIAEIPEDTLKGLIEMADDAGYKAVRYCPYDRKTFYEKDSDSAVYSGSYAMIYGSKILYKT